MNKKKENLGQVTLEMAFAVFLALLLLFGMIRVFQWGGYDLADRGDAHQAQIIAGSGSAGAIVAALDPDGGGFVATRIDAAVASNIFD